MQHPFAGSVVGAVPTVESSLAAVPGTMIFAGGVVAPTGLNALELEEVVAGLNKGGGSDQNPPTKRTGESGGSGITSLLRTEEGGGRGTPIGN